jgi:hypothetical protein
MSILIGSGTLAPFNVTDYFPTDNNAPFTLCAFVKVIDPAGVGFFTRTILGLSNTAETVTHGLRQLRDGVNNMGFRQHVDYVGGNFFQSINMIPNFNNGWVASVAVFSPTDLFLYTKNTIGGYATATRTNRNDGGFRNLVILKEAWGQGATRIARLAVYRAALTAAQAQEYQDTGAVVGLTPYSQWNATSDWGGGTIADSGSSATAITVPAGWTYSADNPTVAAGYTQRKGSTFDATHTLGTITTATLNGVAITINSTGAGTVNLTDTSGITTSGVYNLVLGDGAATQTQTVQINVFGVVPSNNPAQKDGVALASLTNVQVRITSGTGLNGVQRFYSPTETTDASGNFRNLDLSSSVAVDADPVLMHVLTAAGDSIISPETVGLI